MKIKRTQILMEPDEYQRLQVIAERERVSVAELIRTAVRDRYLRTPMDREQIVQDILDTELPFTVEWETVEQETTEAHGGRLP